MEIEHSFIDEVGQRWWRIVGLAKDLGVTEMCVRNWMEQGLVERKDVEGDKRPRVRLASGVVVKEGARRGVVVKEGDGGGSGDGAVVTGTGGCSDEY